MIYIYRKGSILFVAFMFLLLLLLLVSPFFFLDKFCAPQNTEIGKKKRERELQIMLIEIMLIPIEK